MNANEVSRVMLDVFGPVAAQLGAEMAKNVRSVIAIEALEREIPLPLIADAVQPLMGPELVLGAIGDIVGTEAALREALADAEFTDTTSIGGPYMHMIAGLMKWARKAAIETIEGAAIHSGPSSAVH